MSPVCPARRPLAAALSCLALLKFAHAADVTRPVDVTGLRVTRPGSDVALAWDAVTTDALGAPESIGTYRVYRGVTPDFGPGKTG